MTGPWVQGSVVVAGMLLAGGVVALAYGWRRAYPRLPDGFAELDGTGDSTPAGPDLPAVARSERAGLWLYRHTPMPLLESQRRMLELRNKPVAEFFADKLIMGLLGLLLPAFVTGLFAPLIGLSVQVPIVAGLVGALVGYFLPDLLLLRGSEQSRTDAEESLFTYFDLVTLERMANLSATQSLESAAATSDNPVFVGIRAALLRARLEQQPPFAELRQLAERLRLPQLADIADVMQLDETGAAVTGTLRARVRELRDAHLAQARIAAHAISERMTVFMAVPAMVFGLIFLTPPLLRLLGT